MKLSMKTSLKRSVIALLASVGMGAGLLAGTAPAQAQVPNLHLTGGVYCNFGYTPGKPWGLSWNMTRYMKVTAQGGDFRNVTLQEINGAHRFKSNLRKGESLEIRTVWFGCFPSSIAGYTISDYAENLVDNAGFWWNIRRVDNPLDRLGTGSASQSGGGTNVAGVPAIPGR